MRTSPPNNFDLSAFYDDIYTFQKWELFPGFSTQGPKDVVEHMRRLQMRERLDGLRVLDIVPWNGFFSFECARRGAAEVVSLGPDDPDATGYNKTRELLEIDNCHYVRASVYDLSPKKHGIFDVVLFLGLIYHLRHPLLALDLIYDVAKENLLIDSPIIDNIVFDKTISEEQRCAILEQSAVFNQLPMVYYTGSSGFCVGDF
jgi:tRNA (mo5U34)-methyltransferase